VAKKLVRDNIIEIIKKSGRTPDFFQLDPQNKKELFKYLTQKLTEELDELSLAQSTQDKEEEIADILEVLDSLSQNQFSEKISKNELKSIISITKTTKFDHLLGKVKIDVHALSFKICSEIYSHNLSIDKIFKIKEEKAIKNGKFKKLFILTI
jgi:predicted house-cleaning noncanonical NTP pyrophosphatase (MazG superfamily)